MKRFRRAVGQWPSYVDLVLEALRASVDRLPELVLSARPGPRPDDIFPGRPERAPSEKPEPLRIRPTAGQLEVVDNITKWVNEELSARVPGSPEAKRSEVVAAALDAYLAARKRAAAKGPSQETE